MATAYHLLSDQQSPVPAGNGLKVAIVVAEWNSHITGALLDGCISLLREKEVDTIDVMQVPGTFELTYGCAQKVSEGKYDAVIAIGCVVRGDTPHFDYICQGVTQGITHLNLNGTYLHKAHMTHVRIPVIFCVLTTETMQQAQDRTGGTLGNKGKEAAETALKMCKPLCY